MMRRDVLVYLSGPMTQYEGGPTIEHNLASAIAIHHQLLWAGVPNICPHLSGLAPSAWTALTPDQWLEYDEAIIDRCTHLLMLPDWRHSNGARHEYRYAMAKQLPIALSVSELMQLLRVGAGDGDYAPAAVQCCMARHQVAVAPWTCDCPCHAKEQGDGQSL